jgi:hypothetical protein
MPMIRAGIKEFLWMAAGALFFLIFALLVLHFRTGQGIAGRLEIKEKRANLVAQMRLDLTSESEAEKSAVLAVTDKDSGIFADQARAATDKVGKEGAELGDLTSAVGTRAEKELLARFSKDFNELKLIDKELLALAVENTNLKAYALAFGPSADALQKMDVALSAIASNAAGSTESGKIISYALGAQIAALHIQSLLAPHIAEENDKKMDELEAVMNNDDAQVRKYLAGLASISKSRGDTGLRAAAEDYSVFSGIRKHILSLSRENTNVRSLTMSLGQKRKALVLCQDELAAIQQAIGEEQVPGINYDGSWPNPR